MAVISKKCGSENSVLNGKVRGKQVYLCKDCKYNFIENDGRNRNSDQDIAKRSLMNWIKRYTDSVDIPDISGDIKEKELDEMWHYIESEKQEMNIQRD